MSTYRVDVSSKPIKATRTPQGGLVVDCAPTRTGVLLYRYPGGRVVRELRHPDDVFHADALESLKGAPVTVGHPADPVTVDNYKELSVGTMGEDVRADGIYIAARARIQDKKAVAQVENRELVEMSCGYDCDIEESKGEYNGERYDAIQRNIRYNHVALGPRNWGRAGNQVGLRLDSNEIDVSYTEGVETKETVTFKADEFVSRADHDKEVGALESKVADLESKLAASTQRADAAEARVAPAALDALVAERQAIVDLARSVIGKDFKADGKTAAEIRLEAVKAARPSMKLDGKSEAFVAGVFESLSATEKAADESHKQVAAVTVAKTDKADSPRDRMIKDLDSQFVLPGSKK